MGKKMNDDHSCHRKCILLCYKNNNNNNGIYLACSYKINNMTNHANKKNIKIIVKRNKINKMDKYGIL